MSHASRDWAWRKTTVEPLAILRTRFGPTVPVIGIPLLVDAASAALQSAKTQKASVCCLSDQKGPLFTG